MFSNYFYLFLQIILREVSKIRYLNRQIKGHLNKKINFYFRFRKRTEKTQTWNLEF